MAPKRGRAALGPNLVPTPAPKRARLTPTLAHATSLSPASTTSCDLLSPLSDELLVRILSFLSLPHLLRVAPVSRRFHRLAGDSQLWKALYYGRFVLPRALRIPGFRGGAGGVAGDHGHKLHYKGKRTLWADGRKGGLVRNWRKEREQERRESEESEGQDQEMQGVDWKRQYKIRHNWASGKCAVEELRLGVEDDEECPMTEGRRMLVKVVEGIAITADRVLRLRAWDLKHKQLIAQISLGHDEDDSDHKKSTPSCLSVDDSEFDRNLLEVAVGFSDGSFGLWKLHVGEKHLLLRYRHESSSNGELVALAFSYPYLLTATKSVLVSLYTFDVPVGAETTSPAEHRRNESQRDTKRDWDSESSCTMDELSSETEREKSSPVTQGQKRESSSSLPLPAPLLLTSLKSYTSRPPLALSIRKLALATIASIAYTFTTRQGWSIGIQDLHIRRSSSDPKVAPEITTTRLAFTAPVDTGSPLRSSENLPLTPSRRMTSTEASSVIQPPSDHLEPGPTTLCYTHPYLLATLPDNTLILHLCTANASSLTLSPGIRLWGHTSGISDAEITSRGKAVSVSSRGEEMRVWELEGRVSGIASRSVEIRPGQSSPMSLAGLTGDNAAQYDWDERRNWVGFDDEMVIVLKEKRGGRESLMVYDFT